VNVNLGTTDAPQLHTHLNLGNLWLLPEWSVAPHNDFHALLDATKAAGYDGVQGISRSDGDRHGLRVSGSAAAPTVADVAPQLDAAMAHNPDAITVHLGTGIDDDATVDALVSELLHRQDDLGVPLYIETHRATLTDDLWRTVQLVERFPDVRFNGDFSHWYTGHELPYGNLDTKLEFLAPVFERTRYLHGRIGSPGCIQVDLGDTPAGEAVDTFRRMWTSSMRGFLATAEPGDVFIFTPELLPALIHYAREIPGPDGPREESDRWTQALVLVGLARECWAEARSTSTA
jgi:hypothetical protein